MGGEVGVDFDPVADEDMLEVLEEDEKAKRKNQTNARKLRVGLNVTLKGIKSKSDMNGRNGRITFWNSTTSRWRVEFGTSYPPVEVGPDNLIVNKEEIRDPEPEHLKPADGEEVADEFLPGGLAGLNNL